MARLPFFGVNIFERFRSKYFVRLSFNALKFLGDTFQRALYKLCAGKIGLADYQTLVQEKLRTADELYDLMLNNSTRPADSFWNSPSY